MELSAVVCTYNRAHLLVNTLKALSVQDTPANLSWELIVVDNNSDDKTAELISECSANFPIALRYIFEPQQGLSCARNRGLAEARGRIIAFTDDDVMPTEHWVTGVCEALKRHEADGLGGRVLPKWTSPAPKWLEESGPLRHRLAMLDSQTEGQVGSEEGMVIFGANMAFRRSIFEEVGLFDVRLGPGGGRSFRGDDLEFVERAVRAGKKIVYDPSLMVWHHVGPERMEKRYFRRWSFDLGMGEARLRSEAQPVQKSPHNLKVIYWHLTKWIASQIQKDPLTFTRETELWYHMGYFWGCLHQAGRTQT